MGLSPRRISRGGPLGADERTSRASSHLARSSSAPQRANSTESGGPHPSSGIRSLDQGVERCNATWMIKFMKTLLLKPCIRSCDVLRAIAGSVVRSFFSPTRTRTSKWSILV